MQRCLKWLVTAAMLLTFASILFAQSSSPSGEKKKRASKAPVVTAKEVQELKDAVAAQQQQIEQLRQLMESRDAALTQAQQTAQQAQQQLQLAQAAAAEASQKANAAENAADQQKDTVSKLNSDLADVKTTVANNAISTQEEQTRTTALEALVGRFRLSGDVRIRGEGYFQPGVPDDNLARIRVRFGVDGKLNEDFIGGFALATGSLGNPTSTNETLTNAFDRKTIALDRGYITYNPVAYNWLSFTGGKFPYTWQRTSATFDPDLNPEGFNEKFSFQFSGPVQNFTVQGIELLYNSANSKLGVSSQDSYALGGQVSARLQLGPWSVTPSFLSLKWNRPDALLQESAFATGATSSGFSSTSTSGKTTITKVPIPGEGSGCAAGDGLPTIAPCVFAPNGMTNATFVDSKGVPHFYSGYNYADFILNNQIQDGLRRLPINLLLEFEDNLDAEPHPLSTTSAVLTNLGSQNKQYGGDISIGQVRNKNDVQFGYAFNREEQDAAIASFVESDQRAPTNILQHRIYALWKLRSNTLASFTWWHGRALNTYLENNVALFNNYNTGVPTIKTAGEQEPYLNRFQFDLIYTF